MTRLSKRFESEFPPHLFVIDPEGCGCTDCQLGYSTPEDRLTLDQVTAAMVLGMILEDRR